MLVIGGTHSGCGKSTVTLGLLAALKRAGHGVQPFKSGPDFIDAGLHGMVAGRVSRNLDVWMCGEAYVLDCVKRHTAGAGLAVIEGVMGLFDGADRAAGAGWAAGADRSTAALARLLGANIVLVVDAFGMAESAGAVVNGFSTYNECGALIRGAIFNRVSSRGHYERLKGGLPAGVEALGFLPRNDLYKIASRHLGLAVAEEAPLPPGALEALADAVTERMDLEKIAALAAGAPASPGPVSPDVVPESGPEPSHSRPTARPQPSDCRPTDGPEVRIAVARDRAFCFYYEDNMDMLRAAGARLVPFSPIADRQIPEGVDAIYLGGGYPELAAAELARNKTMLGAISGWAEAGRPVLAECGGFMYLGRGIRDGENFHPLCGVFPIETELAEKPVLGYREATLAMDCILGRKGDKIRGHEFHYSRVVQCGERPGVRFNILGEGPAGPAGEIVSSAAFGAVLGGYTHFHLGSNAGTAGRMVEFIRLGQIQKKERVGWKP